MEMVEGQLKEYQISRDSHTACQIEMDKPPSRTRFWKRGRFCPTYFFLLDMTTSTPAIYQLNAKTQSYDWGKLGDVSKVAEYARASGADTDPSEPYAEVGIRLCAVSSHFKACSSFLLILALDGHPPKCTII